MARIPNGQIRIKLDSEQCVTHFYLRVYLNLKKKAVSVVSAPRKQLFLHDDWHSRDYHHT